MTSQQQENANLSRKRAGAEQKRVDEGKGVKAPRVTPALSELVSSLWLPLPEGECKRLWDTYKNIPMLWGYRMADIKHRNFERELHLPGMGYNRLLLYLTDVLMRNLEQMDTESARSICRVGKIHVAWDVLPMLSNMNLKLFFTKDKKSCVDPGIPKLLQDFIALGRISTVWGSLCEYTGPSAIERLFSLVARTMTCLSLNQYANTILCEQEILEVVDALEKSRPESDRPESDDPESDRPESDDPESDDSE